MAHRGPVGNNGRAEWTEVADVPFDGGRYNLPKLPNRKKWLPQVEAWWEQIRVMPHCALWSPTDWVFAIETAYMKLDWWEEYFGGVVHSTKSTEIRRREDQMGTTVEARRKLRIRYVPPPETPAEEKTPEEQAAAAVQDEVAAARRRRIAEAS